MHLACQKASKERRRAAAIALLGGGCVVCGSTDRLEFHHKDPTTKTNNISRMLSRRWELLEQELRKCELRCHDHHMTQHPKSHGTHGMRRAGCECDLCVELPRKWNREYKAMRRLTDPAYGR